MKLNATFSKSLQNLGLTPDQYSALRWIKEMNCPEFCQKDLGKLMFTDPNNIAALVKRMEKNGLISRNNSNFDQRKKVLLITSHGLDKWQKASGIAYSLERKMLSGLSKDEQNQLLYLLRRIGAYLND